MWILPYLQKTLVQKSLKMISNTTFHCQLTALTHLTTVLWNNKLTLKCRQNWRSGAKQTQGKTGRQQSFRKGKLAVSPISEVRGLAQRILSNANLSLTAGLIRLILPPLQYGPMCTVGLHHLNKQTNFNWNTSTGSDATWAKKVWMSPRI